MRGWAAWGSCVAYPRHRPAMGLSCTEPIRPLNSAAEDTGNGRVCAAVQVLTVTPRSGGVVRLLIYSTATRTGETTDFRVSVARLSMVDRRSAGGQAVARGHQARP